MNWVQNGWVTLLALLLAVSPVAVASVLGADEEVVAQEQQTDTRSVSYQVFEPAIIFFRKMRSGLGYLQENLQVKDLLSRACKNPASFLAIALGGLCQIP